MEKTFYVESNGVILIDFVSRKLEVSKKRAKELIDRRKVYVGDNLVWMAKHELRRGDLVSMYVPSDLRPSGQSREIPILFRGDHYFVINKPSGIVSNRETKSAENQIRKQLGKNTLRVVHRLDKETSGCLVFAYDDKAYKEVIEVFRNKAVEKTYHAIVVGKRVSNKISINSPIEGREAITNAKLLKQGDKLALLEITIETGRTHQIRKHLQSRGYPIVGDRSYFSDKSTLENFRSVGRTMLHAESVSFECPLSGQKIRAKAPYPDDFKRLAATLKS